MSETTNPVTQAGANRVLDIEVLRGIVDDPNPIESITKTQSEMLAVRMVSQRYGIAIHHARVVCELAGIGGSA